MFKAIPYPQRSMAQGDRMQGHYHLHQQSHPSQQIAANVQKQPQHLATPATVSRVYRTCTNLFLTRRLPDALATLQPVIADSVSPRVKCSRTLRTKVWSLYFAILDAAAKMGNEEGKKVWGGQEWRNIIARVRSGAVWDEAIAAYGGEGRIDGDVVNALVTLLLAHSQDHKITQKKIEAYLSAAPNLMSQDDDPKGVSQRVKLVELYVLHVLTRVGEWEYAREFTNLSGDLDDEQKEIFHVTLDQLQKDFEDAELYAAKLAVKRQEEWDRERRDVEDAYTRVPSSSPSSVSGRPASKKAIAPNGHRAKSKTGSVRGGNSPETKTHGKKQSIAIEKANSTHVTTGRGGIAKSKADSTSLFTTTTALLNRLQAQMGTANGRFALLRTVIMVAVVIWMTSKRRVRERVRRLLLLAWIKTTRTVGMGMKVTYI